MRLDERRPPAHAQTERRREETQCQIILLHTSVKLGFNGHIITFLPVKLEQFQLNPSAHCVYLQVRNRLKTLSDIRAELSWDKRSRLVG